MATVLSPGSENRFAPRSETCEADLARLGERLRRARERRGLTLEDVTRETKISQRHLQALEQGTLGANGPGFYQRAEIRAFAKAVGLDEKLVLAQLDSALKPSAPELPREMSSTRQPQPSQYVLAALAVATVVAIAISTQRTPTFPRDGADRRSSVEPVQESGVSTGGTTAAIPTQQHVVIGDEDARERSTESNRAAPDVSEGPPPTTEPGDTRPAVNSVTELVVTTEPEGARVTVNGIGWGVSPVRIRHLPSGDKRIRVSKDGYVTQERSVHFEDGRRQTLRVQLAAEP